MSKYVEIELLFGKGNCNCVSHVTIIAFGPGELDLDLEAAN